MRQTKIFSGSSHPALVNAVCEHLGQAPSKTTLGRFANGETRVELGTSIRNQDVFILQSGSDRINDDIMELLIMISACKGGSAKSITAVIPYYPYSRQSKKKQHRGAITARMLANLLKVAGVTHVITIDLHASQIQGFFHCPIDNLFAEHLIARWAKDNVPNWQDAVVASKNAGGTKRATSLADRLETTFCVVMTERERPSTYFGTQSMYASQFLGQASQPGIDGTLESRLNKLNMEKVDEEEVDSKSSTTMKLQIPTTNGIGHSSLHRSTTFDEETPDNNDLLSRTVSAPSNIREVEDDTAEDQDDEQYEAGSDSGSEGGFDPRNRDIVTGRAIQGHYVDDDVPSPAISARSGFANGASPVDDMESLPEQMPEYMLSSYMSATSSIRGGGQALGGSGEGHHSDDEEENLAAPDLEFRMTLVGNVKGKNVFMIDDLIDKPTSWITAAEFLVKKGGALKVYCFATHGLFGDDSLEQLEQCECIEKVVVTNTCRIATERLHRHKKLQVIDVSGLLAEAIRRTHNGESISQLYYRNY